MASRTKKSAEFKGLSVYLELEGCGLPLTDQWAIHERLSISTSCRGSMLPVGFFLVHFLPHFELDDVPTCWTCSLALPSSTSRFVPTTHTYLFCSFSLCSLIKIHHLHLSCLVSALLSTRPILPLSLYKKELRPCSPCRRTGS